MQCYNYNVRDEDFKILMRTSCCTTQQTTISSIIIKKLVLTLKLVNTMFTVTHPDICIIESSLNTPYPFAGVQEQSDMGVTFSHQKMTHTSLSKLPTPVCDSDSSKEPKAEI